jgi:DNA repair ATPase RecN
VTDDLPNRTLEIKRLEYQRTGISITVLDQKAQLEDFVEERATIKTRIKELQKADGPVLPDAPTPAQVLRGEKAKLELQREIIGAEMRLAEIEDIDNRFRTNISASEQAIIDIDENIQDLKEAGR